MIARGLGELRKYLPRGYATEYATLYGCSRSKIYKVAKGELKDYRILEALKEEAEANFKVAQQIKHINQKLSKQ